MFTCPHLHEFASIYSRVPVHLMYMYELILTSRSQNVNTSTLDVFFFNPPLLVSHITSPFILR